MLVVDAPPDIVKSPDVMVEEALERKPLVKVASPVCVRVELTVRVFAVKVPIVPVCEKRFVELATVEKKLVVVPAVSERFPRVVRPVTPRVDERVAAPEAERVPSAAACAKRFVLDAVVLNKLVLVAELIIVLARVERPVAL